MGVAATKVATPAPAQVAVRPPVLVRTGPRLVQRACDCGASAGLSGHCAACDRTSLWPSQGGLPGQLGHDAPHGVRQPGLGHDIGRVRIDAGVVRHAAPVGPQTQLRVSSPGDAAEREAHAMGQLIARMPEPPAAAAPLPAGRPPMLYRRASGAAAANTDALGQLQNSPTTGSVLPGRVRNFMEPRFGADFGGVRIHTGERAAALSGQLSAQAFTVGRDIYFGRGQFQPDAPQGRELIAHELTHTIQQGSVQQGATVQRAAIPVAERAPASVQRFGISDAWAKFAEMANLIPGFRMLTIVLGVNPLTMAPVDRSAANVLRAIVEFMPGGGIIVQALQNSGVFEKVGAWATEQIATLAMSGAALRDAANRFLGTLSFTDIFDLGGVWERAKRIFTEPVDRLIAFAKSLAAGILKFIKDAVLLPLAKLAEGTPGWNLLTAVLGKNPITGEPVPQTAEALIGGFLKLIGQDEVWENMKKSNAIPRAVAWYQGAKAAVVAFVSQIPGLFVAAFKSLTIEDVVLVAGAFQKVAAVFGGFFGKFTDWAGKALWDLLELIFDAVSPGALSYIKKTGSALKSILQNPMPFVGNLVKAAKLGFENFGAHFGTHLKAGLIDWLTGSLPGIYIPKAISLVEIGKFALSVLGITWAQIRGKIVKALGPNGETIMAALEKGFDIVVALVKGGPAAAWDLIKEHLTDLKDTVISGITSFVIDTVVQKAIPKLISLFVPGAGFISAILSIYDTVMVFVNKLAKIAAAVKAFVDSIVAIAAGQIEGAAAKIESTLAGLVSLAISFLAGFLSLGNIASKLMGVIQKVHATVDKAMDTAIGWVVGRAKTVFAKLFGSKEGEKDDRTEQQKSKDLIDAIRSAEQIAADPKTTLALINKSLPALKKRYRLTTLTVVTEREGKADTTFHFEAAINPKLSSPTHDVATSKKQGDHVFARGIGKTLQEMQAMTTGSISNAALRQSIVSAVGHGLAVVAGSPFDLVVDKGVQPVVGDAHSVGFGATTQKMVFAYRSYLIALDRASTSQGSEHAQLDSRMLAEAKGHVSLLMNGWVDAALDPEAAALLPEKQGEISHGKQLLQEVAATISGAIGQT